MVSADSLNKFPADCPCLIRVKSEGKQKNNLHIIYGDIKVVSLLDGFLCLVGLNEFLFVDGFDGVSQLGDVRSGDGSPVCYK